MLNNGINMLMSESSFMSEWVQGWNLGAFVLVLVGVALVIIEMLIPGFGVAGVSGAAAIIAGLAIGSSSIGAAMLSLAIIVVILLIAALLIFRVVFGKKKGGSRIILKEKINSSSTDYSSPDFASLIGKEGETLSDLRPSGIAIIGDKRMDVLADGEFIAKGSRIVVSNVRGLSVSVRKKD